MVTAVPALGQGALEANGLTWRPHGRREPTLDGVDLALVPGERVLLVGASGSGKSTLLQALAGLLDETVGTLHGRVALDGHDPQERPGSVGLLLQDPRSSVVAEHAGRDVAFGPENRALPRAEVQARVPLGLGAVGFPYGADRATTALSGGESARLALAGALALEPRVLLLDEPTAMLDASAAARVRDAVRDAATSASLTLVVAEHQLEPWLSVCDRLVVLDHGRVLADGPLDAVLRERADALLAAGVWVPGAATPEPLAVPLAPPGRPRDPGLRWTGLALAAPDGERLTDRLDGTLSPADGLGVLGPSGAGKSTLLRALVGLDEPADGLVELRTGDGWRPAREVARSSPALARQVGLAAQHSEESITARTVLGEVRATGEVLHAREAAALAASRARADALIDLLGLTHLRDEDPYALSGGEQRRVVLAAALAHGPGVLLLDEPTVGQDRHTWAAVAGLVAAARGEGAAVVATTHDPRLAALLGASLVLPGPSREPGRTVLDHRVRPVDEPGAPVAARCNPLTLLAVATAAGIGSFWVTSPLVGLLTLALTLLASPLAVRRVRPVLVRLVPVALAALSVGWSTLLLNPGGAFSVGSAALAAREVTRILCLVVPGALLLGLLRPSTLGDALSQRLHLPDRPVVAVCAALLRLDDLLGSWRTMTEVRRVRGLGPGRSLVARVRHALSLTLALLVRTIRSAQQMALSMDARGFAAVRRRTHALPSTFARRDVVALALGLLLLAAPIVLSRTLG